jgi:predicted O-methyltransferase YrrM
MSDTLQLILEKLDAIEKRQQAVQLEQKVLYRQIEALFALYHQIDFQASLPNMRSWVASPDILAVYSTLISKHQPKTILEIGGGTSTIISAYCLQQLGYGHVYALEHQEQFAQSAQDQLKEHGLTQYATVIHAPLVEHEINGTMWLWYDVSKLEKVYDINILLVDGPPQYNNPTPMARYPALPLLESKLKSNTIILVDDADREQDYTMCLRWEEEYPIKLIRYYEQAWADVEKGARLYYYMENN